MLRPVKKVAPIAAANKYRWFQTAQMPALKQRLHDPNRSPNGVSRRREEEQRRSETKLDEEQGRQSPKYVKRNELGVQLLCRKLHSQIFRNVSFPAPPSSYVQISKEHLAMHELDPAQGSVLADIGFRLPPLQGSNLLEHFHRIGGHAAEPWLNLSRRHASVKLPPKPDHWEIQSGWTKYHFRPDASSYSEHVDFPIHNGKPEDMLTFDVETMPNYHPHAVMACAASENAWYAWISPWLLEETDETQHLIPFGDPSFPKVIIGHNVSYDRGRILEEYSLESTQNRFIDTMALHVAVNGISSHQRPAWMKYRKSKQVEAEQQEEATEAVLHLLETVDQRLKVEVDEAKKEELQKLYNDMSESVNRLQVKTELEDPEIDNSVDPEVLSKRWEEITAANSLADVAKLHCGIIVEKQIRSELMTMTSQHIRENIFDFLDYCSNDVSVTHEVYSVVLPAFLAACPHPVSFAGMLTMGSSFLPVNEEWERYLERAERTYRDLEDAVQNKLKKLAEDARSLMGQEEKWKQDPWLSQLDWTPKTAAKSRGILPPEVKGEPDATDDYPIAEGPLSSQTLRPSWHIQVKAEPFASKTFERTLPVLLQLSFDGHPMKYNSKDKWHYIDADVVTRLPSAAEKKTGQILSRKHAVPYLDNGRMRSIDVDLTLALSKGDKGEDTLQRVIILADTILEQSKQADVENDPWLSQLDWTIVDSTSPLKSRKSAKPKPIKPPPVLWPKWYWEATKPRKDLPPGTLEITSRNRISPLLLRLSWMGWPLCHSREHGWIFRVPCNAGFKTRASPLSFYDPADDHLNEATLRGGSIFYKLPHKDGEKANVGSPLGKSFIKYGQDGTLRSPGDEAKEALEMNALCSYWISARDRIMNQMIIWQDKQRNLGFHTQDLQAQENAKWGIILPQVITMGTVTRRAIEKTWLTASNAKKNRVGSELKAMVRAPPGYAIVGADVDSEELWISSCMGDAQFGLHGATAIGWMTLEGTKAAGTDLHSKTAKILNISRDDAKVFNYSRIYGAGMRHAILLLLQSNAGMLPEQAQKLAENLYASTKGKNTHRTDIFERKFWFGGSESYLFNKLEEIALSDKPQTPALGCSVTYALSKEYLPVGFGTDYLPSRINWVVQSSGVDYLHLLIVSMDYLSAKYDIKARYLISVHDELRYLVVEEDKYRAALAMQIANLWTRSFFAYKLGMDDLPQGVAFFSAVDVDKVLRKEVYMPCVTPSQPNPIPPGESLDISGVLAKTNGGTLQKDGRPMPTSDSGPYVGSLEGFTVPDCLAHRSPSAAFLRAQATTDFGEVKGLAQQIYGRKFEGGMQSNLPRKVKKRRPLGNGDGVDWSEAAERILNS